MSDERTTAPESGTGNNSPAEPEPSPLVTTSEPPPVVTAAEPPPAPRRTAAVWWGLGLVLVGAALLVSQFVPTVQLWRFWPVIIIALGVRQLFGPSRRPWSVRHLGDGLVTIAIGLVFLGQMTGYLGWDVWLNILRLWPLLLVALGIEILGKGLHSEVLRVLSSLIIVGGLAYGALVMTPTAGWPLTLMPAGESTPFEFSEAHDPTIEEATARVDGGVGALTVEAGAELVTADGRSPFTPQFDVDAAGRVADVRVGLGSGVWGPFEGDAILDVTLDESVVWDLDVNAGVTFYTVDLRDLAISGLRLDAGVSDGTLLLGPAGAAGTRDPIPVSVEAGISSLKIRVPEGDSVRVSVRQGLTGVTMRGDWTDSRNGDLRVYETRGFRETGAYWDIDIDAGIGGITIEQY